MKETHPVHVILKYLRFFISLAIILMLLFYKRTKQSLCSRFRLIPGVLSPFLVSLRAKLQPLLAFLGHLPPSHLLLLMPSCEIRQSTFIAHRRLEEVRARTSFAKRYCHTLLLLLLPLDPLTKVQGLRDGCLILDLLQTSLQFQFVLEDRFPLELLLSFLLHPLDKVFLFQSRLRLLFSRHSLFLLLSLFPRSFLLFFPTLRFLVLPTNPFRMADSLAKIGAVRRLIVRANARTGRERRQGNSHDLVIVRTIFAISVIYVTIFFVYIYRGGFTHQNGQKYAGKLFREFAK